jgi:hypothetical protein
MERVAFLIEETRARLGAMLNPEAVELRRRAGFRPRSSLAGALSSGEGEAPLLYAGGGTTELRLDLLFDVELGGSTVVTGNVRELTGPLWALAENAATAGGAARPATVRFVWGKTWNIRGVVTAVSERLERFDGTGAPRRSWLRMVLVRVPEERAETAGARSPRPESSEIRDVPADQLQSHALVGGGGGLRGERLDELAQRYYGDPSYWRLLAGFNAVDDPLDLGGQDVLQVPPGSAWRGE